jgi:alpha-amylase
MQHRKSRLGRARVSLLMLALFLVGVVAPTVPANEVQAQVAAPRTAFVHLFEWRWKDVARECETYLGPKGYAAVQVSPPNEHVWFAQSGGNYPWWLRYQPVSYSLGQSRSGTLAEFQDMVTRCRNQGVDIYVDAVINHMSAGSGTGINGTNYTKYSYPIYSFRDFHADPANSPEYCARDISGSDYGSNTNNAVRRCELVSLSDLNTTASYVRGKIAEYLTGLVNLGVKGFRIDAAKHMNPEDIDAIINQVNNSADAAGRPRPYVFQEVIDKGGEAVKASDYFNVAGGTADVHEFKYGIKVTEKFRNNFGNLSDLRTFGTSWGLMASDKGVAFIDNHDEQRTGRSSYMTYQEPSLYRLANVFMLAWNYGYPQVMSSYGFSSNDQGPPSASGGVTNRIYSSDTATTPSNCGQGQAWQCEHRWQAIGNMVAFRNNTQSAFTINNWWDNGSNQIAFSRGNKGFVVINRQDNTGLNRAFTTGLPAGTYCDIIHANFNSSNNTCSDTTRQITVDARGVATISVNSYDAVALHVGARVGGAPAATAQTNFNVNATTVNGQNVYVVGNIAALGSWNTANAVLLSTSGIYPNWAGTISLPPNTAIQYKYIKKDGSGNVIWEGGSNRTFTTGAGGSVTNRTGDFWQ